MAVNASVTFPNGRKLRFRGDTREDVIAAVQKVSAENAADFSGPPSRDTQIGLAHQETQDRYQGDPSVAVGQNALAMVTGAALEPIAGIAGAVTAAGQGINSAIKTITGGETRDLGNLPTAASVVERVRGWGYTPKTEAAISFAETLGDAVAKPADLVDRTAEHLSFGSPIAATAIRTMIAGAPDIAGGGIMWKRGVSRANAVRRVEAVANEFGVDLGDPDIIKQMVEQGRRRTSPEHGAGIQDITPSLRHEAEVGDMRVDQAWELAREYGGERPLADFANTYAKTVEELDKLGLDVEMMPHVQARLDDWENTINNGIKRGVMENTQNPALRPGGPARDNLWAVKLADLDRMRQRLYYGVRMPSAAGKPAVTPHPQEARALDVMQRNFDSMLQRTFDRDMFSGSADAQAAWKNAVDLTREVREKFSADKTIRRWVIEENATPEDIRKWIFGANSVNQRGAAMQVVDRLKAIFNENGPEMNALRKEFAFDVVAPLLRDVPDVGGFIRNYENTLLKNRSLVENLAPYETLGIDRLYEYAKSARNIHAKGAFDLNLTKMIAQLTFGHEISRSAMEVSTATAIIGRLRNMGMGTQRDAFLRELGANPTAPIIPKGSIAFGAFVADQMQDVWSTTSGDTSTETE